MHSNCALYDISDFFEDQNGSFHEFRETDETFDMNSLG